MRDISVWPLFSGKTQLINTPLGIPDWMKKEVKRKGLNSLNTLIDRLSFFHILLIWTGILIMFGLGYHFLSGESSNLLYSKSGMRVENLFDSIYFSFVTATSTGFGDIIPLGYFKLFAIIEVVFGLVLLAFVTSKLVSIKQDVIMNEIYDISFDEKINRIRSSLLLFRMNLGRVISNIESNTIRKREISDIYNYISSFGDSLKDIRDILEKDPDDNFTKVLDQLSAGLVFNSISQSFEKLAELIAVMTNNKLEWRREITLKLLEECLAEDETLFERLQKSRIVPEKDFVDLLISNRKAIEPLKSCMRTNKGFCEIDIEKI
jgi:hypothetical protein